MDQAHGARQLGMARGGAFRDSIVIPRLVSRASGLASCNRRFARFRPLRRDRASWKVSLGLANFDERCADALHPLQAGELTRGQPEDYVITTLRRAKQSAGLSLVTLIVFCLLAYTLPVLFPRSWGTTVSDNFDRADGLGSNWTTVPGMAAPKVVSNAVMSEPSARLTALMEWEHSVLISSLREACRTVGSQFGPGIAVRLSGTKGYFLWYRNSANTVSLWRMDSSSSWFQLKQSGPRRVAVV